MLPPQNHYFKVDIKIKLKLPWRLLNLEPLCQFSKLIFLFIVFYTLSSKYFIRFWSKGGIINRIIGWHTFLNIMICLLPLRQGNYCCRQPLLASLITDILNYLFMKITFSIFIDCFEIYKLQTDSFFFPRELINCR